MATVTAQSLIHKAQVILQDTTGVRWTESELLDWLNDGQCEVALYKPNACVRNTSMPLQAGTKQALPADGIQLIDVLRNRGPAGTTPGRAIRIALREVMDAQLPSWHSTPAAAEVRHYLYNPLDPKTFYVWPPQPESGRNQVEIIYGAVPGRVSAGGVIAIDDIYQNVLVDYILYRAYSKDAEYAADQGRADKHRAAFLGALEGKIQTEVATNPNRANQGNATPAPR